MKKIYIHCEITKREFEGKLLLSILAANNNFEVYLGNISGLESKIDLPSGIFHHTSCVPAKFILDLFKRLKKRNFVISCQDEEGGVEEVKEFFTKLPKGNFYYRFGEKSLKLVNAIFSWSNFDYDNLIARFPKFKNKIFNTGNPRVDMWSQNLKDAYKDESLSKKYILISSNVSGPANNKTMMDDFKAIHRAYFEDKDLEFEKNKSFYFEQHSAKTRYMNVFLSTVINLTKRFKNQKFIFRPHPTENLELWKFLFRKCKNIVVTKENSSTYWMHKSKILIQNGCYTSIEASNLGLDIVTYIPKEIKKYAKPFTASLGFNCLNQKQLFDTMKNILNKQNKKNIKTKKLKNFNKVNSRFHFPSKILNSQKIVEVWLDQIKENKIKNNYFNEIYFQIFIFFKKINFILFKKIKIDEKVILDRKFEDINYNKTNLMTRKLIKILGLNPKIKFELIDNHICRIVKR